MLRSDHKLATKCCVLVVFRAGVARLLRQRCVFTAEIFLTFYAFRKFFDLQFDATWIVNDGLIPACLNILRKLHNARAENVIMEIIKNIRNIEN